MHWFSKNKWLLLIVALVIIAAVVVVLRRSTPGADRTIIVILPSSTNPYWLDVRKGAEQAANELRDRYDVQVQASLDQNAASQIDLLNSFFSRNAAKALVLGPANDSETVPTVAKYSAVGIPVVLIDTELNPEAIAKNDVHIAAFIGSDNVDGGRKAAKAMSEALKNRGRRVLLIEGSRVHQSAIDRAAGFTEVGSKEGLEIIPVNGEWKRDRAQELVASQLARGKLDGIFASNDDMALGAIAALRARGTRPGSADWPIIIGFDATRDGLTAVANGEMYGTVQQDANGLGHKGVLAAVQAMKQDPKLLKRDLLQVSVRLR